MRAWPAFLMLDGVCADLNRPPLKHGEKRARLLPAICFTSSTSARDWSRSQGDLSVRNMMHAMRNPRFSRGGMVRCTITVQMLGTLLLTVLPSVAQDRRHTAATAA